MASITRNTEVLTDQSSLSTNLLRRSALSLSDLGIHCTSRAMLFNRTEIKNVYSRSLEINFRASDSDNSTIDFNSILFQLSNVEKQHKINSFQFTEHRTLADILGFPLAADNEAENPPKATSLASESTMIWVANVGLIE